MPGDDFGAGIALGRLAFAYLLLGEITQGTARLDEALVNARRIGDRAGEAWALETLGTVARAEGRKEQAEGYWRGALALYEVMPEGPGAARTRSWLTDPQACAPTLRPRP